MRLDKLLGVPDLIQHTIEFIKDTERFQILEGGKTRPKFTVVRGTAGDKHEELFLA
jgi:hypothetical protein